MNVSLPERLEEWIHQKVSSGLYQSASEVVREALRLLREQEELRELRRQELRSQVQEGIDQLDRGEARPFDKTLISEVKKAGRRKREESQ